MKLEAANRVHLEPLVVEHARELFPLLADPAIFEYISGGPPASVEALSERYRRLESRFSPDGSERWLNWVIRRIVDRQCVGFVQATIYSDNSADFAFVMGRSYWGLGLAREASAQALAWLLSQFGVECVRAIVDRRNTRSSALLGRLGFQQAPSASYPHGTVLDSDDLFCLKGGR